MANVPIHNLTDTWSDAGTEFTAIRMNVTDTASASGSKLMDLLLGGVSQLALTKAGDLTLAGSITAVGGNLTGTVSGDVTLSGNPAFTGAPNFSGASNKPAIRTALGLEIGSDVQAWDADLDAYAGNPLAAAELDQLQNINSTTISAAQWGYLGSASAFGGSLIDDADATAARSTLGLGSIATQDSDNVSFTGGSISNVSLTVGDSGVTLQDNVDATKQLQFQLSDISTGTTRTLSAPDANGVIALTNSAQTISASHTFSGNPAFTGAPNFSGATNKSTIRSDLGIAIGTNVQAWDADLDTYAANPLTAAELGQLQNIGATTISATQWGYVGALTASPVEDGDIGVTVQAYDADLDVYAANPLTAAELAQLQNIGTSTVSATQWDYVGGLDQALTTTSAVTFSTVNGRNVAMDGTKLDGIETGADVTDATNVAAAGAVMDGDFSANGIMARTAAGAYASRTLSVSGNGISVTNGTGAAGNPTYSLSANLSSYVGAITLPTAAPGEASFVQHNADGTTTYTTIASLGGGDVVAANNLSDLASIPTARTNLGLAIGTDVQAYDADLAAIAGLTSAADRLPYFTGASTAALATFTGFARTLLDDADAATARTTLGVAIGTNVQAFDAGLASIAGLTTSANQGIYLTGADTYATFSLTAAGRALLDDADASAQRTTLGATATGSAVFTAADAAAARTAIDAPRLGGANTFAGTQTISGGLVVNGDYTNTGDTGQTAIYGGSAFDQGAGLVLYGDEHPTTPNQIDLVNSGFQSRLRFDPSGNPTFGGRQILFQGSDAAISDRTYSTFALAHAAAVSAGTELIVTQDHTLTADFTVTVPLRFVGGSITASGSGVVVQIRKRIYADPETQIFTETSGGKIHGVVQGYLGWWGATGTNEEGSVTDDTAAILSMIESQLNAENDAAVDAGSDAPGAIVMGENAYGLADTIDITLDQVNRLYLKGSGRNPLSGTRLAWIGNDDRPAIRIRTDQTYTAGLSAGFRLLRWFLEGFNLRPGTNYPPTVGIQIGDAGDGTNEPGFTNSRGKSVGLRNVQVEDMSPCLYAVNSRSWSTDGCEFVTSGYERGGELTFTGVGTDGDTVTLGSITYTLKNTLSAANHVKIGATAADTCLNLVRAINANGTAGTDYGTGTTANADAAAARFGAVLKAYPKTTTPATAPTVAASEVSTACSWSGLNGGNLTANPKASIRYEVSNGGRFCGDISHDKLHVEASAGAICEDFRITNTTNYAWDAASVTRELNAIRHSKTVWYDGSPAIRMTATGSIANGVTSRIGDLRVSGNEQADGDFSGNATSFLVGIANDNGLIEAVSYAGAWINGWPEDCVDLSTTGTGIIRGVDLNNIQWRFCQKRILDASDVSGIQLNSGYMVFCGLTSNALTELVKLADCPGAKVLNNYHENVASYDGADYLIAVSGNSTTTRATSLTDNYGGTLGCVNVGSGVFANGIYDNVRQDGVVDARQTMNASAPVIQGSTAQTISGGVTGQIDLPTAGYCVIDTEAAAATDDLHLIEAGQDGQVIILSAADGATKQITLQVGATNSGTYHRIFTHDGSTRILSSFGAVALQYRAGISAWVVLG